VIAYVDASVLLRLAFGQPDSLAEWPTVDRGISSALVITESLRTLDRLRLRVRLSDSDVAERRAKILELIASLEIVEIDGAVLNRAALPMPTALGTLDAIHLATALLWREMTDKSLTVATHDEALAMAVAAHGLPVVGAKRT
jgi:predicted nucleic acid-binding protein